MKETPTRKDTIAFYAVLAFLVIGVLASLEPVAAVGPAVCLIVWIGRKVLGIFNPR